MGFVEHPVMAPFCQSSNFRPSALKFKIFSRSLEQFFQQQARTISVIKYHGYDLAIMNFESRNYESIVKCFVENPVRAPLLSKFTHTLVVISSQCFFLLTRLFFSKNRVSGGVPVKGKTDETDQKLRVYESALSFLLIYNVLNLFMSIFTIFSFFTQGITIISQ